MCITLKADFMRDRRLPVAENRCIELSDPDQRLRHFDRLWFVLFGFAVSGEDARVSLGWEYGRRCNPFAGFGTLGRIDWFRLFLVERIWLRGSRSR